VPKGGRSDRRGLRRTMNDDQRRFLAQVPDQPTTARELADRLGLDRLEVKAKLMGLKARGYTTNNTKGYGVAQWWRTPAGRDVATHKEARTHELPHRLDGSFEESAWPPASDRGRSRPPGPAAS
jgi:biotin operon repressor